VDAEGDVPKPAMQGCTAEPASPTTDVGVVVIGRNEGERLRLCLESVLAHCPLVVYVDSGSTDGSVALARQLGMHVVELDARQPCTAARGRQAGLDFLRSVAPRLEFVQFLDGDCVLRPGWVESAAAFLRQRRDVAAVCGRRREVHAERSSYSRLVDVDWDIPPGEVPYFGGDVLCSVSAIDAAGGWSTDLIAGEEPELCFRLRDRGKRIWRLAREATEHDVAMSRFGEYWRRAVRSGFAYAEVGWRHRHGLGRAWLMRALMTVVYGLIMPLLILLAAFACPLLIVVPVLLYARAAAAMTGACLRKGCKLKLSLTYAGENLVCKLAGTLGVLRWALRQATGGRQHIIEYKRAATGIRSALATGPKAAH
jgi:glycosyltransferase involved in cell wall biosynthesis